MSWFEVHVFGGQVKGEGIILKLPEGGHAVIDCCFSGSIKGPSQNPMVQFLAERNVKQLEFVCLTHPHADHYFGLSQILQSTPPKTFFRSAAMQPKRLRQIIEAEFKAVASAGSMVHKARIHELLEIERVWKDLQKVDGARTVPRRTQNSTVLYESPATPSRMGGFKIAAFAPHDSQLDRYEECLGKCFDESYRLKSKPPQFDHNWISVGLTVSCESFAVLLAGDVTEENWLEGLSSISRDIPIRLVKISHHGSSTGCCEGLWEACSESGKPVAVVTGFGTKKLPRKEMLDHFLQYTEKLFCTHRDVLPKETDLEAIAIKSFINASDKRTAALLNGCTDVVKEDPAAYGRCSFFFEENGELSHEVNDPACAVN